MKRTLLLLVAVLSFTAARSQELSISDALRYAQDDLNGTARFRAMGGAFGALGGDLSAINVNPAGSAIFADSQFGITMSNFNRKNESTYFGTSTSVTDNSFDFNQAGFVFVFDQGESDWSKFTLAVNYDNINNLDNAIYSEGTNPLSSVGNYFTGFANQNGGIDLSLLQLQQGESISSLYEYLGEEYGFGAQQAFLGYQAFVIDPAADYSNTNRSYVSLIPAGENYYQENYLVSSGYNGKLSFNVATAYKDRIFLGLNLNSHFTDYTQRTSLFESNTNTPQAGVQRLRFDNDLQTYGSGFSFQLGAIAKVTDAFRAGLSFESPTWLTLTDRTTQSLSSVSADGSGELPADIVTPDVINEFAPYQIQTPSKLTASFAYVFGKSGLISVDYSMKDYSSAKFSPEEDYLELNNNMSDLLDNSAEVRIGAEYRIKKFSLRGGYRMEQSPYKDNSMMGDLSAYSAGIGYNFGVAKLDLAYTYAQRDYQQQFLTSGMTDRALINGISNNVSLSFLFNL
jgi:hypothetical protein